MFGEKLAKAREQAGLSRKELAEMLNVGQNTIWRWEAGQREPSLEKIQAIARALGVTTDALMTSEDKKTPPPKPGEGTNTRRIISMEDWIKVPIVSREWTACCGTGISAADITNWDEGFILIDPGSLRRFDDRRMPYAVHCEGDCMESAGIKDGDLAIINPAEEPGQGAVVLVSVAGSLSLKRMYTTPSGDVILRSDLGQQRLTAADIERDEFIVCGVLVGSYQGRPKPLPL